MTRALLLLDLQEGLCRTSGVIGGPTGLGAQVEERGILTNAAGCLAAAREARTPVIHSRVAFSPGYLTRINRSASFATYEENGMLLGDDATSAICAEVAAREDEPVVERGWVDPFLNSPLLGMLIAGRVGELFIAGVATNFVVESAARHAGDLGFAVTVIEDACATFSQELHDFAIETTLPVWAEIASSKAVVATLSAVA